MDAQRSPEIKSKTLELFRQLAGLNYGSLLWVKNRNAIAVLNDGLAMSVANEQSKKTSYPSDDIESLARLGLITAIEKYDIRAGAAFSSFAVPFIQGEILHFLRDYKTPVKARIYGEQADKARAIRRSLIKAGRNPDFCTVDYAALVGQGLSEQKWAEIKALTSSEYVKSLDEPIGDDGDPLDVAYRPIAVEESELSELRYQHLMRSLGQLGAVDRAVLIDSYWHGLSSKAISKRRGLTEKEVTRRIDDSLPKLRGILCS